MSLAQPGCDAIQKDQLYPQAPSAPVMTAGGNRRDKPSNLSEEIVGFLPALRIYARSLCRDRFEADDLVQETLTRAIENMHRFQRGTNLRAWLFTIMRNRFYSDWIKRSRERTGESDCVSSVPQSADDPQIWHIRLKELEVALNALPVQFRETLVLVTVLGESYLAAAETMNCDIGTIKSSINRARAALRQALGPDWGRLPEGCSPWCRRDKGPPLAGLSF